MRRGNNRGFAPIFIAVGIVSLLAVMSLTNAMSQGLLNRKSIEQLNRAEGFYSAEILAWHSYERTAAGLVVSGAAVGIDNAYSSGVVGDGEGGGGVPYDIVATRKLSPSTNMIRRYDPARYLSRIGDNSAQCGQVGFGTGKKKYRVCLATQAGAKGGKAILYVALPSDRPEFKMIRVLDNGELDTTFGTNGELNIDGGFDKLSFSKSIHSTFRVRHDRKILLYSQKEMVLVDAKGRLDTAFGDNGKSPIAVSDAVLIESELPANDGFLDYEVFPGGFGLKMIASTGKLDPTFGAQGKVMIDLSPVTNRHGRAIKVVRRDGLLNVLTDHSGSGNSGGWSEFVLARLKGDGSVDTSFAQNGLLQPMTNTIDIHDLSLLDDGKLLIVGGWGENYRFIRVSSDGSFDENFGPGGIKELGTGTPCGGTSGVTCRFYCASNGFVLLHTSRVVGANRVHQFSRYSFDGVLDSSFGQNGVATVRHVVPSNNSPPPILIRVQFGADGSFFALFQRCPEMGANGFTDSGASIYHILANGTLDPKFGNAGEARFNYRVSNMATAVFMDLIR